MESTYVNVSMTYVPGRINNMPKTYTKKFTNESMYHLMWISDPGHSWLQVEWLFIDALGWNKISKYSYHDEHYVYLEEDSAAPRFLEFLDSKGIVVSFSEFPIDPDQVNDLSFVRNLTRF